jgi:hypothetical protein
MRDLKGYNGLVIISPGGRRRQRDFQKLHKNPKTGMVLLHDAAHDDIVAWPAASVGPGGRPIPFRQVAASTIGRSQQAFRGGRERSARRAS